MKTNMKKPPARIYHATCVITSPEHPPQLMVIGGLAHNVLCDVWILDIANGSWSEVSVFSSETTAMHYRQFTFCFHLFNAVPFQLNLPGDITPRYGHSATVFGTGPDFKVVVLFGGYSNMVGTVSKTTLLLLGE